MNLARIRTIKPAFFTSDQVCACSPLARLLFIGLWCEADRDGRLHDKPSQLKFRILPGDACDVDALLWELVRSRLIGRFEAADPYIQILKFRDHQRPHPKEPPSSIAASGRERPWKETASRDQVGMLPVDFPSSPVGREGDLESQEGKGMENGGRLRTSSSPFMRPTDFERLKKSHAHVGARLRVPYVLHDEFVAKLGGEDPHSALLAWYAGLDEALELSREPIPDVFVFLRPKFTAWAQSRHTDDALAKWVAEG